MIPEIIKQKIEEKYYLIPEDSEGYEKHGEEWNAESKIKRKAAEFGYQLALTSSPAQEVDDIIDKLNNKYQALEDFTLGFFYWWYNQKGNNTKEGFIDWIETEDGNKKLKEVCRFFKPSPAQEREVAEIKQDILDRFGQFLKEGQLDYTVNLSASLNKLIKAASAVTPSPASEDRDWVSREEYEHAINEIGQLQEQLKEAEEEIRELSRFDEC